LHSGPHPRPHPARHLLLSLDAEARADLARLDLKRLDTPNPNSS
jgi:hypothetical protein